MSRRVFAIASPVVAVLLLVGGCGSSGPTRADQGRSIAEDAGLPKDVADFYASATAQPTAAFRVVYDLADKDGKPSQVTLTQKPPQRRVDVFHADGSIDSTIATDGRSYQCTMTGATWQCGELGTDPSATPSNGVLDPDALRRSADAVRARAGDFDFRTESRTIAGAPARCLVTTPKQSAASDPALAAAATLCLSNEGAELLGETPNGRFEAKEYTTTIAADAFDLPAPAT